jgi:hypothetical protein
VVAGVPARVVRAYTGGSWERPGMQPTKSEMDKTVI